MVLEVDIEGGVEKGRSEVTAAELNFVEGKSDEEAMEEPAEEPAGEPAGGAVGEPAEEEDGFSPTVGGMAAIEGEGDKEEERGGSKVSTSTLSGFNNSVEGAGELSSSSGVVSSALTSLLTSVLAALVAGVIEIGGGREPRPSHGGVFVKEPSPSVRGEALGSSTGLLVAAEPPSTKPSASSA